MGSSKFKTSLIYPYVTMYVAIDEGERWGWGGIMQHLDIEKEKRDEKDRNLGGDKSWEILVKKKRVDRVARTWL